MSFTNKDICKTVRNKDVNSKKNSCMYSVIDNDIFSDNRLSLTAKGIWMHASSVKNKYKFYLNDFLEKSVDNKKVILSGLKELEENGYLEKIKQQDGKDDMNRWIYIFNQTSPGDNVEI
jgi:hypothetical protein